MRVGSMQARPETTIQRPTRAQAIRIAAWYTLLSAFWIFCSGWVLHRFIHDEAREAWLEYIKGWFFVLLTAAWLGVILNRYFREIRQWVQQIRESEARLQLMGDNLPDSFI